MKLFALKRDDYYTELIIGPFVASYFRLGGLMKSAPRQLSGHLFAQCCWASVSFFPFEVGIRRHWKAGA